ncbi:MAG TPA: serine/threonine-protein kinase [Polyangiaceae bacterium]|nr:serine/threonine-protein kinase [Polyangiaceae bacterium]
MYLAAEDSGREVVLEVLGAPQRNQGMLEPKIADEAASYARLDHPNVVKVVELFSADGRFVIALEHSDGSTLEVLGDVTGGMPAPEADACRIYVVSCVLDALAAAHGATDSAGKRAPVLHRNVNPSNVQISWDGEVKLGHFNFGNVVSALRPSNPGFTWSTVAYLAPEQLRLQKAGPESDVYSAMLMLWELLAGRKAIDRKPMAGAKMLELVMNARVPPLEEVRPGLDPRVLDVVRAGLQAHPVKRTIGAAKARDALRTAIDVESARRRFTEAVGRARATHDAPTVAPPPADEKIPAPKATQLAPPSVPKIVAPPPVPETASPVRKAPPVPTTAPAGAPASPAPVVVELEATALESVHPPAMPPAPAEPPAPVEAPPPVPVVEVPAAAPLTDPPPPLPRRRGGQIVVAVALGVGCCILVAAAAMRFGGRHEYDDNSGAAAVRPTLVPTAVSLTTTPTPTPTPTATATPSAGTAEEAGVAADIPADMGEIQPPDSAAGHRIFVDGRVVGEGAAPIRVPCGQHSVRIGSAGRQQNVDVPCGQSVAVDR